MTTEDLRNARVSATQSLNPLKIFPLPNAVLLPGGIMPLHIFEQRYRQMVADCLAGDRFLAMATMIAGHEREDTPPVHPLVGVGRVVFDQQLEDGRSIIMLQGLLRAEVVEELASATPYRTVHATALLEQSGPDQEGQIATLRHLLQRLVTRLTPDSGAEDLIRLVANEGDPGLLADLVGSALFEDTRTRLRLMGLRAPLQRLRLVNDLLASALRRFPQDGTEAADQLC